MAAGDAAMAVALADSVLFSLDADAARSRVLLFLGISFVPFLFVAPLIGPAIDRMAGGRRLVVQIVTIVRVVLSLLMASNADSLLLFPLAFGAMVAQKTYAISKSALVPTVVRTDEELVEANSKLGLISGLVGMVAIVPAGVLQQTLGAGATLTYSAILFVVAFAMATRLPRETVVASRAADSVERAELHSDRVVLASTAMLMVRASVGFTFFHLYFWFRHQDAGLVWFGLSLGFASLLTMAGNALAPRIRDRLREETMLQGALGIITVVGTLSALLGGTVGAVLLAGAVNFSASIARLAFESIVQRDAPDANRGRAFAQFETRFQLGWVAAGLVPVLFQMPGRLGFVLVAAMGLGAGAYSLLGTRAIAAGRRPPHPITAMRARRVPPPRRAPGVPPPPPRSATRRARDRRGPTPRPGPAAAPAGRTPGRSGSVPPPPPMVPPTRRPTGRSEP
ncbi:MAG: MFS transporter [Ilumatobacteraceae bacterium]